MGSISIQKNGSMKTYNLAFLDWQKAQAANVANSGSTDLGDLLYTRSEILASGTLQNVPDGASSTFYVFKSTNFPASMIKSYTRLSEQTYNRIVCFGEYQETGDKISEWLFPIAAADLPPTNHVMDITSAAEICYIAQAGYIANFSPVYKTGGDVSGLQYNSHSVAYFQTIAGGTFGASYTPAPGSASNKNCCAVQIHSYGCMKYYKNGSQYGAGGKVITGNQAFGGKPYGPMFDALDLIPYPSNEVDYNAHAESSEEFLITDADAKITDDVSAEFVCTVINGETFVGLAACHWSSGVIDKVQVTLLPAWFFGAGALDLSFDFEIPDYSDTWYGPGTVPNPGGSGGYTVRQNSAQIATVPARSYWSFIGQGDAGTHCYLINGTALAKLQAALWNSLVTDEFKQYILSCIVSVHQMPNELMPTPNASNAVSSVVIGNIPVPISGGAKAQIVDPFVAAYKVCTFSASDSKQSLAYYNGGNYLDYEPHVSITLFLPFAGTLQLSASQCIGGKIEVYVASNASNGDCVYTVVTTSDAKILKDADGSPVVNTYYIAGNSAMPILISGTTTGQKQRQSDIYSMIGGAVTMATGAAAGNVGSVAHGFLSMAESQNSLDHIQQNAIAAGGIAGSIAGIGQKQVILRVTRPVKAYDKSWIDLGGIRSEMSGKLEKAKTEDSSAFTVVKYCNTSTLRATEAEKAEVLSLLKGGVYL